MLPIGLFDSGVGGLTILREIARALPYENLIYFGDTARLPLGDKSPDAIVRFTLENAKFLMRQNIKLLIVACHTACSHAMEILEHLLPIPVLGVMAPGISDLLAATKSKRVALLGTAATIASGVFQTQLQTLQVYPIACPLFVPLTEEGLQNHPVAAYIAKYYLSPLQGAGIDAALLACTHYPLLSAVIQQTVGPEVQLIEPACSTAQEVFHCLNRHNLLNPKNTIPEIRFFVSGDPEKFRRLAKMFFPFPIKKVQLA
jgi:glutamate racemase